MEEKQKNQKQIRKSSAGDTDLINSSEQDKLSASSAGEKLKEKKNEFKIDIEEMTKAGVYFGHRTSRSHPKMQPYIEGIKNTVHIIDLKKTAQKLEEALKFIKGLILEGKVILFVGTKVQSKNLTKDIAQECSMPYVSERWLGGSFTNFGTILKRMKLLKDLEEKKAKGEIRDYSKKERIKLERAIQGMKMKFEGIRTLERLPDAIFVLDMRKDKLAVKEARSKGVKVIGVCDTNVDPNMADYPIPANDDAISSVKYILEKVKEIILTTKSKEPETIKHEQNK